MHKIFTTTNPEKSLRHGERSSESFFEQTIALANKLAKLFEGGILTDKVLSICKAQEAVKFKCQNGHVFYKYVDSLKTYIRNAIGRKISVSTAASSSTSSDEESQDAALQYGCWCPKCEEFYTCCKNIAKSSGFKLEGKLYAKNLSFKCPERRHCTPISYNKRISQVLNCADCKREQKEALKEKIRQEEEQQSKHISQMQEEMFRKAREEMERELKHGSYQQKSGAYTSYHHQSAFSQNQSQAYEAERLAAIEQEVNKTAVEQMKAYMRTCPMDSSMQRDQIYIVYKFLNTPIDVLMSGMQQMEPNNLTQFYRKLAKQLHPDKNCHPQAKEAFQRVQSAMEQARQSASPGMHGAFRNGMSRPSP